MIPSQHIIRVTSDRPALEVAGMLYGESTPWSQGGRGGWEATKRTRRSAIVEWTGPDVETYELPMRLMYDPTGFVDAALERLERMTRAAENVQPPTVLIAGMVPAAGRRWAIQDYSVTETRKNEAGKYTSCIVTLSLMLAENLGDGVITSNRPPSQYKARKGDTLVSLAVRFYGSAKHAGALAKAQTPRIRDMKAKLKTGSTVKLP